MRVVTLEVPHLGNRSHLVHDGTVAVVVDPPRDVRLVEAAAEAAGVQVVAVAETHLHEDHVSGGLVLAHRHGADYLVSADEDVDFHRVGVRDHETLAYGDLDLRVIATPGHTAHHLAYLAHDASARTDVPGALFSGGSLLRGSVGRTDLAGDSLTAPLTRAQWLSARRLGALPADTALHPTHGPGHLSPATRTPYTDKGVGVTVGDQRSANPALTLPRDSFAAHLLRALGPVPPHYAHAVARNRSGAWLPRPGRRLGTAELDAALRGGAHVVDVRPAEEYAAGHLPGSLSVPYGDPCAEYAAWVTPWGGELVLVSDSATELVETEAQIASLGVEAVATSVLGRTTPTWTGLERTDWTEYAAAGPPADGVLLDVRLPAEWRAGHLEDAINIPVHELPRMLQWVPPGRVWVHCEAGYRAAVGAGLLDRAGRDVVRVEDRFSRGAELGLPLVREQPAA